VKKILKFTPKNISNIPGVIAWFFVVYYWAILLKKVNILLNPNSSFFFG
jgi:hypothetical protein